jgi:hypothetical protein
MAGTDPTNAASKFVFLGASVQTNKVALQWSAVPGRSYQLLSSTDLVNWAPATDWIKATVSPMSFTPTNTSPVTRLYRVLVRP